MAARKIVWTTTAYHQRERILEYWAERNKSFTYSKKLILLFRSYLKELAQHPEIGKISHFGNTRVMVLGHYSIYYEVFEKSIVIKSVWDNRQNPKSLLNLLRKNPGFDDE